MSQLFALFYKGCSQRSRGEVSNETEASGCKDIHYSSCITIQWVMWGGRGVESHEVALKSAENCFDSREFLFSFCFDFWIISHTPGSWSHLSSSRPAYASSANQVLCKISLAAFLEGRRSCCIMLSISVLVQPSPFLPLQGLREKSRSVAGGAGSGSDSEWEKRPWGLTSPQLTTLWLRLPESPLVKSMNGWLKWDTCVIGVELLPGSRASHSQNPWPTASQKSCLKSVILSLFLLLTLTAATLADVKQADKTLWNFAGLQTTWLRLLFSRVLGISLMEVIVCWKADWCYVFCEPDTSQGHNCVSVCGWKTPYLLEMKSRLLLLLSLVIIV